MAAGAGDLQGAEAPRQLQRALRSFPDLTSLFIAHPPKDAHKFTVSGSGFFQTLPRAVIEQKLVSREGLDRLNIELVHHKSNHGPIRPRAAYRIHFDAQAIRFEPSETTRCLSNASESPVIKRIAESLGGGAKTVAMLAEELGISQSEVRSRLNDGKKRGQFVKLEDGRWALCRS
jgi:hypothetical protein